MKKKETKETQFIRHPQYPGGNQALKSFIQQNLQYPEEAAAHNIEGTVALRYDINHQGKVTDVKVLSSLGHGCDEEAVRLVRLLKFEVPKNRKLRLLFHRNIQIHFKLPTAKKETPAPSVQYTYSVVNKPQPNESDQANKKRQEGNGYQYSINIG